MSEPPVVANRPVGPDRALFLSAVLVLSIVAGLGGGMILVLLDTSFSSLTELRDYTGLRVLGAISDARSRAGRRLAEEIGRAWCRERVCRYWYISVVAVSLQK